ncbi:MAG: EamA family transporter RarD [bacterium]
MKPTNGLAFALGAYLLWGFFPLYWKLIVHVPPLEILAHRMVWSMVFLSTVLIARRRWDWLKTLKPRQIGTSALAALFLTSNWFLYIWAVNSGHVVETSLGYFINPLVNVVFGALILKEKPRPLQWGAIAVAGSGVLYLTFAHGKPPWIALTLAITFGTYALIKKKSHLGAVEGLVVESTVVLVPALTYLAYVHNHGLGAFGHVDAKTTALLAFSGVATALPLLFFAAAARRLTLTSLGIVQYLAPSIQFALGVFVYKEPFSIERLIGFALIWLAVGLYSLELLRHRRITNKLKP